MNTKHCPMLTRDTVACHIGHPCSQPRAARRTQPVQLRCTTLLWLTIIVSCWSWLATGQAADTVATQRPKAGVLVFLNMPPAQSLRTYRSHWQGPVQVLVGETDDPVEIAMRPGVQREPLYANGSVSIRERSGRRLPYPDNSVNCLVVTGTTDLPMSDIQRVLVPRGVVIAGDGRVTEKPWPAAMDQWTHNLYDATNNAVCNDTLVRPPNQIQWIGAPDHIRHHNFLASVSSLVSADGRIFAIVDEGSLVSDYLPPKWTLTARDAFNGVLLWKRRLPDWGPRLRNFRSGPAEIGRRLVAVNDEVFVTLGFEAPISVLDATTGSTKTELDGTAGAEELLVDDNTILAVVGKPRAELRDWAASDRDFTTGTRYQRGLVAIDRHSKKPRWQRRDSQTATLLPMSLTMQKDRGCFVTLDGVTAVAIATGRTLWHVDEPVAAHRTAKFAPTVVVHQDVLLYADRIPSATEAERFYASRPKRYRERYEQLKAFPSRLRAYDIGSGRKLWECGAGESFHTPTDVMVIDNTVWYTDSPAMLEGNYKNGRDLHSGEVVKTIDGPDINHGRCYRNRATVSYLLGGKNGLDFIDPDSANQRTPSLGLRGTCQLGILPCNGMVYLPPHACVCEPTRKLNGFFALTHSDHVPPVDNRSDWPRRRVKGPAFGLVASAEGGTLAGQWPTFRHDAERTGRASTGLGTELSLQWRRPIGRRPTAAVCADGTLFVAAREDHVLWALDAETGTPRWQYRTGGRIDSPPTITSGFVVFGCRDGWLRCLRVADGELVWRFRGAPADRQIVVHEQLESSWPMHGATLVHKGKVYAAAGRASVMDGGMDVWCVDLLTGMPLARRHFQNTDMAKGAAKDDQDALLDVVSLVDNRITLRSQCMTLDLDSAPPVAHLQSATGMLDDHFFHRSYWAFAKRVARYTTGMEAASGFLMATDGQTAYAFGREREFYLGHVKGFERFLYAADIAPQQEKLAPGPQSPRQAGTFRRIIGKYAPRGIDLQWSKQIPILVKGMVVANDLLVVAGPDFELHPSHFLVDEATDAIRVDTAPAAPQQAAMQIQAAAAGLSTDRPPHLYLVNKNTGDVVLDKRIASSPVFDGVIAAGGRLYVSGDDGAITCYGTMLSKGP